MCQPKNFEYLESLWIIFQSEVWMTAYFLDFIAFKGVIYLINNGRGHSSIRHPLVHETEEKLNCAILAWLTLQRFIILLHAITLV